MNVFNMVLNTYYVLCIILCPQNTEVRKKNMSVARDNYSKLNIEARGLL